MYNNRRFDVLEGRGDLDALELAVSSVAEALVGSYAAVGLCTPIFIDFGAKRAIARPLSHLPPTQLSTQSRKRRPNVRG